MTKQQCNVHARLIRLAKAEVERHIVPYDGEKCFNIYTYLQALESKIRDLLYSDEFPVGGFELNAHHIARYLWVCLTLAEGEQPYATTFRGMPTLD